MCQWSLTWEGRIFNKSCAQLWSECHVLKKTAKSLQMAKSKAIKAVCYNAVKNAEKTSEKVILIDRLCDKRVEKNICKNFHQVWSHHVLWKLLIKCVRKYRLRDKRVKTKLSKKCSSHFKPSSALRAKRAVTATYVINQLWWYDTMAVVWVITYIVIIHMGMPSCALRAKRAVTASINQFLWYEIGETNQLKVWHFLTNFLAANQQGRFCKR